MRYIFAAVALTLIAALLPAGVLASGPTAHSFTFDGFDGEPLPLAQFKGRPLLIVNTATECGFTPQLEGLEALWQTYKDSGLVVIGVPSNDFGGQEPRKGEEIEHFCRMNYGVTFRLADRTPVKGDAAHAFYKWAGERATEVPTWNFHKYLIDKNGNLAASFTTTVKPENADLRAAIDAALRSD